MESSYIVRKEKTGIYRDTDPQKAGKRIDRDHGRKAGNESRKDRQ